MRALLALLTTFIVSLCAFNAQASSAIGKITTLQGEAVKISQDNKAPLNLEDGIFLNDRINVGKAGKLEITFVDDTTIVLGEGAMLTIDTYVYTPHSETNQASFQILKGPFYYASGQVAKQENPDVTLTLDFGSIGIRGTKIWRDMTLDENNEMQCRIYLEDGSARVKNTQGFTTLKHGDGTKIHGKSTAPTRAKPWSEANIADIKSKTYIEKHTPDTESEMPTKP